MTQNFGATSTTDDVFADIDSHDKSILVTGVSSGLGVETARALAAHGALVVGATGDKFKAKAAMSLVSAEVANCGVFGLVELDLASLASVLACADALVKDGRPFDMVIANAETMAKHFACFSTRISRANLGISGKIFGCRDWNAER